MKMREIIFRGKDIDNNSWVHGDLITGKDDTVFVIKEKSVLNDKHLVVPESVGQYTEYIDKTGKMIFEGDIAICDGKTVKVGFGAGCWLIRRRGSWDFLSTNAKGLTVIGNEFDNPELLQGKEADDEND